MNMLLYQILAHSIHGKTWKSHIITIIKDHILCLIFKVILNIIKKHGKKINDNNKPLRRIFVNKIKNRITFKIKRGYYIELVTSETMKLLGSSKSKITKDENGKNVPVLEITELVHCNIVNSNFQQIQECRIQLFQISHFVNYQISHQLNF